MAQAVVIEEMLSLRTRNSIKDRRNRFSLIIRIFEKHFTVPIATSPAFFLFFKGRFKIGYQTRWAIRLFRFFVKQNTRPFIKSIVSGLFTSKKDIKPCHE